jgi:hypothetical protein
VHDAAPHVALPNTQPVDTETNVTEAVSKPAGRPPGAAAVPDVPVPVEGGSDGAGVDVAVGGSADDVEALEGTVVALVACRRSDRHAPRTRQPTTNPTSAPRPETVTAPVFPDQAWPGHSVALSARPEHHAPGRACTRGAIWLAISERLPLVVPLTWLGVVVPVVLGRARPGRSVLGPAPLGLALGASRLPG